MSKILIKNGRVIDPETTFDRVTDILIVDDLISAIGPQHPDPHAKVIDATGKWVIPGVIDLHTHLRDMEEMRKETIESGTRAARAGGVTTVFAMPNTKPRLDSRQHILQYRGFIEGHARVEVHPVGAISKNLEGRELAEIEAYPDLGIRFISDDGFDVNHEAILRKAYELAAKLGLTVITHPEMDSIGAGGTMNAGDLCLKMGELGQPNAKEYKAVERAIRLANDTGARNHLTHVTTAESIEMIRHAKKHNPRITCDVTPHHLLLTEHAVETHGTMAKVNPPLRTEADRLALIEAVKDGTVDLIATDHAPHSEEEKSKSFKDAPFGISGLETLIAATLTELVFKHSMDLSKIISLLTIKPARVAGLPTGRLQKGAPADISLIDPEKTRQVDRYKFASLGKNTPFHGMILRGWPVMTIVRGAIY